MSDTIGKLLKQRIPENKAQKTIAIEWLETWSRRHPNEDRWSVDTAESRLSQCLRDKPIGVKFYLGEDARFEITCEAFGIDAEDRARLKHKVDEMLAQDRPIRLAVDVTTGPQVGAEVDTMFGALKACLLGEGALLPVALVLTERQYDRLPRSFDVFSDNLVVEKVTDPTAARKMIDDFGSQGALIATPYPRKPFEQWMAIKIDTEIHCEPANAVASFMATGKLPGLKEVKRPLSRIATETEKPPPLPTQDPLRLRVLMQELTSGEPISPEAWGLRSSWQDKHLKTETRLAWARELGVEAAATNDEWIAALPKRIAPVPLAKHGIDVARWVARCSGGSAVFALSDKTIAINPSDAVREELTMLNDVVIEEIAAAGCASLEAFLHDVATVTAIEQHDDPLLFSLVDRHAKDDVDKKILEEIRKSLVALELVPHLKVHPAPTPVADWRSAMNVLLDDTDPEARIRIRRIEKNGHANHVLFVHEGKAPPVGLQKNAETTIHRQAKWDAYHWKTSQPATVLPIKGEPATWTQQILEAIRIDGAMLRKEVPCNWEKTTVLIPGKEWDEADRQVAFMLGALRAALRHAEPLPLPRGRVLMPLGNGIFAEIHVCNQMSSRTRKAVASLIHGCRSEQTQHGELLRLMPQATFITHYAQTKGYGSGSTELGLLLPHGLYLSGRGFLAEIVLRTSPLFMTQPVAMMAGVASAAGHIDADEHRRRD